MKSTIEKQKQEMKNELSKSVDAYFKQFAKLKGEEALNVDEIEKVWGEGLKHSNEIFAKATAELAKEEKPTERCKKTALNAEGNLGFGTSSEG